MNKQHFKWYSPTLGHDTEMLTFGHAGYPVIIFPTSMGSYTQNYDFHLINTIQKEIEEGKVKVFCPGCIDNESWYNKKVSPAERAHNNSRYEHFIFNEIAKRATHETGHSKVALAGCSFGGYHTINFAFRNPEKVGYAFSMGGAFDMKEHLDGLYDEQVYFHNPPDYVPDLWHPALYDMGIVLGVGERDFCLKENYRMSAILQKKNIPHWLDVKPNAVHDWPIWREMFPEYVRMIK